MVTPAALAACMASSTTSAAPMLRAAVMPVTWNHLTPVKMLGQSNCPRWAWAMAESLRSYRIELGRGAAPNSRK